MCLVQVSERALFFWENEYIVSLMEVSHNEIFPILLPCLLHASNFHWNKTISSLAHEVLQRFMHPGNEQFEKIVAKVKKQRWAENKQRVALNKKWEEIEKQARKSPLCKTPAKPAASGLRRNSQGNTLSGSTSAASGPPKIQQKRAGYGSLSLYSDEYHNHHSPLPILAGSPFSK